MLRCTVGFFVFFGASRIAQETRIKRAAKRQQMRRWPPPPPTLFSINANGARTIGDLGPERGQPLHHLGVREVDCTVGDGPPFQGLACAKPSNENMARKFTIRASFFSVCVEIRLQLSRSPRRVATACVAYGGNLYGGNLNPHASVFAGPASCAPQVARRTSPATAPARRLLGTRSPLDDGGVRSRSMSGVSGGFRAKLPSATAVHLRGDMATLTAYVRFEVVPHTNNVRVKPSAPSRGTHLSLTMLIIDFLPFRTSRTLATLTMEGANQFTGTFRGNTAAQC